ncbi:hypothetical protein EDC04DRAFT_2780116 [Pisolithus marmoratus]|nr:hypothetical protein EDC04DRAFT_2780116 [Pisolithus marmoratus]
MHSDRQITFLALHVTMLLTRCPPRGDRDKQHTTFLVGPISLYLSSRNCRYGPLPNCLVLHEKPRQILQAFISRVVLFLDNFVRRKHEKKYHSSSSSLTMTRHGSVLFICIHTFQGCPHTMKR